MNIRQAIHQSISDCFIIWRQELTNIRRDIAVVLMFIGVPLLYPLLYGSIYNTETIRDVPLVVVDESHSALAREFVRRIGATAEVQIVAYAPSLRQARDVTDRKEAYGILQIPADFSAKIHRDEQAVVALYIDMSGLLFYKAILLATTEASLDMRRTIRVQPHDAPLATEAVALYNPHGGFASFLLPAILILVIQQSLLLGIGILAATTRERNRRRLIPVAMRHIYTRTFRIVFGKTMAYLALYTFVCFWTLVIVPYLFRIPQLTNYSTLLLFLLPYLLAATFFAMFLSTFIRGRETPMMLLVFTSLIFLFLSGVSWPLAAMPDAWRYIGYLIPSTFGIQGFVKINTMSAELWEVAFEYRNLWLQAGIYFTLTALMYYRELLKVKREELNVKRDA
ncbi:MAG: ABC transporter permease [Prevotellaceae bacterium]|jgi:ABC-2 type transport system permease protein|nr:ABC transporter permease [Prevotellaceae bacterium]